MTSFAEATRLTGEAGRFTARLAADWEIWGPNGGYLSAIALRAAGAVAPAGHRPVTFAGQYLASPASGEIAVEADPVRVGRSAGFFNVRLIQNGRLALQAQVTTTARDQGPQHLDLAPPKTPDPGDLRPIESYLPADHVPHPFWAHFDGRPVRFFGPGERDPRGAVRECWYRLKDFDAADEVFLDHARAVLLIDTLPWPTYHSSLPTHPSFIAPSLDLTVWFHDRPAASDWLLLDSHAQSAKAGLIHGGARVWSEDRRLLASGGSQLLVVEGR